MNGKVTRKNSPPIKVYCLPEEKQLIEEQAKMAGMSTGRYLREVGQGYVIQGTVDCEQVRELARINGDLGRLGGLLKLWLTNSERLVPVGEKTIRSTLNRIEQTQTEMAEVMMNIMMPRTRQHSTSLEDDSE